MMSIYEKLQSSLAFQGIVGNVTLGGHILTDWTNTPIHAPRWPTISKALELLQSSVGVRSTEAGEMLFYNGTLEIENEPTDTFLRLDGWTKVNNSCIYVSRDLS